MIREARGRKLRWALDRVSFKESKGGGRAEGMAASAIPTKF